MIAHGTVLQNRYVVERQIGEGGEGFPAVRVLAWADQLLDALEYLHTQEPAVVHRDIKPHNLKLTARDQIVLLDFGLAKGTPLQTRVTATGSLFGYSFNYAPIEQMQGAGADPRSNLYSLGATVYQLLTRARVSSDKESSTSSAASGWTGSAAAARAGRHPRPRRPAEVFFAL